MDLVKNMPGYIKEENYTYKIYPIIDCLNGYLHKIMFPLKQLKNAIEYLKDIPNTITSSATALFGIITNVALVILQYRSFYFICLKMDMRFQEKQ